MVTNSVPPPVETEMPGSEDERFACRVAALIERCYGISNRQLVKAATDDIADIKCSTKALQHKAERFRRGR